MAKKVKKPRFISGLWRVFRFFLLCGLMAGLILGAAILYLYKDLPPAENIYTTFRRHSIRVFDQKGNLLATYGDVYGDLVPVEQMPDYVANALLAIEDKRFYQHFGIDFIGIARAIWANYRSKSVVQGGSTITQQLAKNILQAHKLYDHQDRSLKRKAQEAILAFILESRLTKKQILTLYLNRVYFGGGAFGIDAAAKRYYGRSAREISIYEAAVLMGLLKAPSRYSPAENPERSENRTKQVLLKMVEGGFLTPRGMETVLLMASPPPSITSGNSVRYFTDWVVDSLRHYVSLNQDLDVITTIDLDLQKKVESAAKKLMQTVGKKWNADQTAVVLMTETGDVLAMLGGTSYRQTKFNRVTQALRQPGSSFKFFTFLSALENGLTPETLMPDGPITEGSYRPRNYLYTPRGEVTLLEGFAKSINTVAYRVAQNNISSTIQLARRLGVTSPISHNLSISLGSSEMTLLQLTGAFATIANKGVQVIPHGIQEVKSKRGHTLFRWTPSQKQIVASSVVNDMFSLMRAVHQSGTARMIQIGQPIACKTGTSQNYRDHWVVGFTPLSHPNLMTQQLVFGMWTGRDSDKPMTRVPGGAPSRHLCQWLLQDIFKKRPKQDFSSPFTNPDIGTVLEAPLPPPPDVDPIGNILQHQETASDNQNVNQSSTIVENQHDTNTAEVVSDKRQAFGGWERNKDTSPQKEQAGSDSLDALLSSSS
jgi:penicillin-binding protein 1A